MNIIFSIALIYVLGILATMLLFALLNRIWFNKKCSVLKLPPLAAIICFCVVSWIGFVVLTVVFCIEYLNFLSCSDSWAKKGLSKLFGLEE
jgi:hypothetical protein